MIYFPQTFLFFTILVALIFSGIAVVVLLFFLFRDKQKNEVW
jgi:hypothetical protein